MGLLEIILWVLSLPRCIGAEDYPDNAPCIWVDSTDDSGWYNGVYYEDDMTPYIHLGY